MRVVVIGAALACSACTSVRVNAVEAGDAATRVGLPYSLPFTQYRLQLARQVESCGPQVGVSASAKVEETRMAPDPLHRFVIDPNSLSSILKTSELKAEYHPNGMLKSLNATAEDKTGDFIANIGSIGVKIATLAAGGGSGGTQLQACRPKVVEALNEIKTRKPKLQAANQQVEAATEQLKRARAKVADLGAAADETAKKPVADAYDALVQAIETQKNETKALAPFLETVTHTETVLWPANGDVGRGVYRFDEAVLARWAAIDTNPTSQAAQDRKKLDIYLALLPLSESGRKLETERPARQPVPAATEGKGTQPRPVAATKADTVQPELGIPFRQSDYGWLRLCTVDHCDTGGEALLDQRGNVLQLGYVHYLPCRSYPFTSISCNLEMTEEGSVKSIGTAQKQAALVGATDSVEALLDSATTIKKTLDARETATLEAKTKALKAEADYRAALKALDENANASVLAETATTNANLELARARKNLIEAEAALRDAQALLPPAELEP